MNKLLLTGLVFSLCLHLIYGQFIVNSGQFQPMGLSNQGLVAGYQAQAGPYFIWNPNVNTTVNIGGLAPGNGIGGKANFSDDGNVLCGTSSGLSGAEISLYHQGTQQWSVLGSLGFEIDSTVGGGFGISGDGNTVVGLSWADTSGGNAYAHAVAWNLTEGILDLGSRYDSIAKSTRANAVSYDGKVVVGWQDFNGPWKSAVWRKNPAGGYFPNEYLLIDTTASATDEFNQLGECSVVSADGNWIGGYGDYANNNQPWIWSEATGVVNLGSLPNTGQGFVSGINADGSKVVGWFDGMFFGDPQTPFIWTPTGGLQNLNAYIQTDLGLAMGTIRVQTANCMSANGQYIAGYGMDTTTFSSITYRVSANPSSITGAAGEMSDICVFPNPLKDKIHIKKTDWELLQVFSVEGKEITDKVEITIINHQTVLDLSRLPEGIYFVRVNHQSVRIMKNP